MGPEGGTAFVFYISAISVYGGIFRGKTDFYPDRGRTKKRAYGIYYSFDCHMYLYDDIWQIFLRICLRIRKPGRLGKYRVYDVV